MTDRPEAAALKVLGGYASVGLVLAVVLGLAAFVFHDESAGRAVCSTGAMAGLFGAAAGLNLRDRIRRRKSAHVYLAAGILAVMAAALVGVSVMSVEEEIPGAWSPLVGAGYLLVLAVICWRLAREMRSSAAAGDGHSHDPAPGEPEGNH